jgi:hypothetical protein
VTDKPTPSKAKRSVARPEGTTPLNINLPTAVFERLDAWVERLNAGSDGPRWTRTDLIRTVLVRALNERGDRGESP